MRILCCGHIAPRSLVVRQCMHRSCVEAREVRADRLERWSRREVVRLTAESPRAILWRIP